MDIGDWLHHLGLARYEPLFRDHDIDVEVLPELTDSDLQKLGISLGHRKKLLKAIAALREPGPTQPAGRGAERRQLTVLFCDLVGSTELSARLDPEDMSALIRVYQNTVAGEITRFEGYIAKYMGDGILAYFGWPRAKEDAAERALRAGLAAVEAVGRLAAPDGVPLAARVGIATGLVVVGELIGEGAAQEQTVVGDTPNLAARLQQLALAGNVVISETTRRLLGGLFEFEDATPATLKGFPSPPRAYRVLGEGKAEGRFEALHGAELAPLVGREHELGLLLDHWERARKGEGQVVLLAGEAGIGKSRLMQALRERLSNEPYLPLSQYCSPFHQMSALYPVIGLLERAAQFATDDPPSAKLDKLEAMLDKGTADVAGAAPLIAALLSLPNDGRYAPLALSPQRHKERTLEVLLDQLSGLAARQPLLQLFEDVHWADPTTLELLDLSIGRVRTLPVTTVITFRPEFAPRWLGHAHVTLLKLSRLGRRQGAAMVECLTGGKALPAEVLDQIIDRTDGVPLFIEELTKAVLELGLLREDPGGYALAGPLPPLAIPSTLQDSLMARLDRLAPVKEVAQIGAVIGREFSRELLAAISDLPDTELDRAMAQLLDAGLIFRRGAHMQTDYIFKHALVQDAAYNSLLNSRRRQVHARIAQILEERFPTTVEDEPAVLAHHFYQADLVEKAVEYHERAGRRALARSAVSEALAQFNIALERLGQLSMSEARQRRELAIQLALGNTHIAARGFAAPATGESYRRAAEIGEQLGETRELFAALYGLSLHQLYRAQFAAAQETSKRLLAIAGASQDRNLSFYAHRAVGLSAFPAGKLTNARHHIERALALYDPEEHRTPAFVYAFDPRVVCLTYLGNALLPLGLVDRALATNEEAIGEARRTMHANSLALPLFFGGLLRQIISDSDGMRACCTELTKVAADAGLGFWQIAAAILRGWLTAEDDDVAAGRQEIERRILDWQAAGAEYLVPYFLVLLAQVELRAHRPEAALEHLSEARRRVEETGEGWFAAEVFRFDGEVLARLDRRAEARASLLRALNGAAAHRARFWELRAALSLARLAADAGSRERVKRLCLDFGEASGLRDIAAARHFLAGPSGS